MDLCNFLRDKQFYCIFDCLEYLYYAGYSLNESMVYSSMLFNTKLEFDLSKIIDEKKLLFLTTLNGCELKIDLNNKQPNIIFWNKNGVNWSYQDLKNGYIFFKYNGLWSIFDRGGVVNYFEIQSYIKNILEEGIKLKGYTPSLQIIINKGGLEEGVNLKGYTPVPVRVNNPQKLEEGIKLK